MSNRTAIFLGMLIGSYLGSYIVTLLGVDVFSYWTIVGNVIGGIAGILIAYKLVTN